MYTILENAKIVIALLKEHNIKHVVVSPGGSNIPIVQGIQNDPFFTCYSVVDERSAMYFAIGLYLQLGVPIATSCTSAQATRNYVPGLTEAFYKHVPILAITMSKHPRFLSQEYMQCSIQTSLPIDSVKKSYSLPYISSHLDRTLCVRVANEAMLELTHHSLGPVQLNIEELDNETWVFNSDKELPQVRCIRRYELNQNYSSFIISDKKILIVIGEHRPFGADEIKALDDFTEHFNAVVYSDHISNYCGKYAMNANLVASSTSQKLFEQQLCPNIVITIGGQTGDYDIFNKLLAATPGYFEHWRVDKSGDVVDTYGKLTKIFEMDFFDFCKGFIEHTASENHSYFDDWKKRKSEISVDVEIPFSNLYAAQILHKMIPVNSCMHYAILNSLRVWNYFDIDPTIRSFSNVAAFGIDGCLSTLVGQSVASPDNLCFHITGDLSFFYDMNALGIRHIGKNIRILLVNNNGGIEFKLGDLETKTDVGSYISAAGHFKNARGWAESNGFTYLTAKTKEEFKELTHQFISNSDSSIIMEIFTNPDDERTANDTMIAANWKGLMLETFANKCKVELKRIIGQESMGVIKKFLK